MSAKQKEKGFTIIEVVLVLAIAGLIFMMVFLALPALQRSQRDTQRKNDLSRAITAITNYSGANRGNVPTTTVLLNAMTTSYLVTNGDSFVDPSGSRTTGAIQNAPYNNQYEFAALTTTALTGTFSSSANQNMIYPAVGYICDPANTAAVVSAGSRKIALRIYLESGGYYCLNN